MFVISHLMFVIFVCATIYLSKPMKKYKQMYIANCTPLIKLKSNNFLAF